MNVVQDEELVGDNIARLLLLRQQARILACIHCSISAVLSAVAGAGTKTCTQRQATLKAAQMAGSVFCSFRHGTLDCLNWWRLLSELNLFS